ncbi:hypothetical protein JIR001_24790 [Polycladomyces abyssicola]|uniref:Uncharacterized protein n=1 Tax=Polycladomyces abyssicola TaxID=1125966 RepID=A0A8D5ZPS3_9BACL|nr:hypothetical protein JIR001_24790 [Polycladomyces abyssicola]
MEKSPGKQGRIRSPPVTETDASEDEDGGDDQQEDQQSTQTDAETVTVTVAHAIIPLNRVFVMPSSLVAETDTGEDEDGGDDQQEDQQST